MYPHSVGYVEGLGEGAVQASEQAVASITSSALASTKVRTTSSPYTRTAGTCFSAVTCQICLPRVRMLLMGAIIISLCLCMYVSPLHM